MIFVDTNVLMYAVGRRHPLRSEARAFFETALTDASVRLCTSAEVLQELLHAYVPVQRITTLDAALQLAFSSRLKTATNGLTDLLGALLARHTLTSATNRR